MDFTCRIINTHIVRIRAGLFVRNARKTCKDHAFYERNQNEHGEWVCTDCHKTTNVIAVIVFVVFIVIVIIVLIFTIVLLIF